MKKSGIYKIECIANNKTYVGSAVDLDRRWKRHLNELRTNKHVNVIMQNAFDKYGENTFIFTIIEIVNDISVLKKFEQFYLDTIKPFGKYGFNINTIATGGNDFSNHPNKEEIFKKISKSKIEKHVIVSDEHRAHLSKKLSEYFKTHSVHSKGKTYEEMYGVEKANEMKRKISEDTKKRCVDGNGSFKNKKHSDESKRKMSNFHSGKYFGKQNIPVIIDNEEFPSYGSAAKKLGTSPSMIKYRCLSNNPKFDNYILKNEKS
jgi:group I intron endonuclease